MCKKILTVLTFVLTLMPGILWAADYKDWLPYLPDKLDGLKATSKGEGVNINADELSVSSLSKIYGGGDKKITISIMHDAGQQNTPLTEFVEKTIMETKDLIYKTVKLQGFGAIFQYNKNGNDVIAIITVSLKSASVVTIAIIDNKDQGEKHYIGLVNRIDLKKIYATL